VQFERRLRRSPAVPGATELDAVSAEPSSLQRERRFARAHPAARYAPLGRQRARYLEPALFRRHQIACQHIGAGGKAGEFEHLMRLAAGLAHHGGADQRADDVALIAGPHPLGRIGCLERLVPRLREQTEVLLAADNRCYGRVLLVLDAVVVRQLYARSSYNPSTRVQKQKAC